MPAAVISRCLTASLATDKKAILLDASVWTWKPSGTAMPQRSASTAPAIA